MSIPKNPPAFPRTGEGVGNPRYDEPGMKLRDWFAGMALAANADNEQTVDTLARDCYEIADAMLTERERQS